MNANIPPSGLTDHKALRRPEPGWVLTQPGRVERLITVGRSAMAAVSLWAVWIDPSTPARYVTLTYALLALYLLLSLAFTTVAWSSEGMPQGLAVGTLVLDLAAFTVIIYLTEGPSSPFFPFFTFAVVSATLRWSWRGAMWTAGVILVLFAALGAYSALSDANPALEINSFAIRLSYLSVVALLLAYYGAYESRLRGDLMRLAQTS